MEEEATFLQQEIVAVSRSVGLTEVDKEDVSQLLDSHGEEFTAEELIQFHEEQRANSSRQPDSPPSLPQLTLGDLTLILNTVDMAMAIILKKDHNLS